MKSKEENTYYCIVTGSPKYIPPSLVKNKLKKFGSKDDFRNHYISREARKMLKQNMTVDEIRQQLNCSPDLPSVDPHILARLKLLKKRARKGQKEAQEQVDLGKVFHSNRCMSTLHCRPNYGSFLLRTALLKTLVPLTYSLTCIS